MRRILTIFRHEHFPRLKLLLMILSLLISNKIIYASLDNDNKKQDNTFEVSGIVKDASTGEVLPGVSIVIKGTATGTVTGTNGNYTLTVSEDDMLVFSFIGYNNKEIAVGTLTEINVELVASQFDIDEVVVIGYGVQKKKLATGATVHVESEKIDQKHSMRIEQALQGLSPGVHITANTGQPGEKPKVRIRGVGTVGNSDPLYVVDGVPTDDIRYLNPSDVEAVDVLKDAASAAIYGARAANGVILITTKKGKSGEIRITYDGYYGVQNVIKKVDLLNTQEYMMIMNEANANTESDPKYTQDMIDNIEGDKNWLDYLFIKNAPTYSNNLSFTGGSDKSIFSSSVSYFKQYGIVGEPGKSSYDRISARFNSEHKVYKNILKIGENLVYTHANIHGIGVGNIWGGNNIIRNFLNATPTYPVYDANQPDGFAKSWVNSIEANPYALMHFSDNKWDKDDIMLGNMYAEITILEGLKFRTDFGINLKYNYNNKYEPVYNLSPTVFNPATRATMGMGREFTYNFENYLTYSKAFNKHNLMLLAGTTASKYNKFWMSGRKEDLIIDDFDFAILDNATNDSTQKAYGSKLERALLSYFGRVNYNFDEKYLFTATLRADGSSMFGPEKRYGYFPSFSAGWVVTNEDFVKFDWLNYFKIRSSWGQNGNDKIGDFQYQALISSTGMDYYFGNDNKIVGSAPEKIHNPKIQWETSEQIDIGFDGRFLKDFTLAFDVYRKTTKDWLIIAPISDLAGNDPPTINGGNVRNEGIEMDMGYYKMKGDLTFSVNANVALNKNKVTEINNEDGVIKGEEDVLYNQCYEVYRAQVDLPIGFFYGYVMEGIFQSEEDVNDYTYTNSTGSTWKIQGSAKPGDIKFADLNNDGSITDKDKTMIGDPNPDVTFGLSLNAQYKGFDVSLFMQGVAGNQILCGTRNYDQAFANYPVSVLDRWHGENTSNTVPRAMPGNSNNFLYVSKLFIQNGSYLKIRSVNIGYDLKQILAKTIPVQKFRVYLAANNLFTFTKYTGFDPEVGYGDYDEDRYENYSTGIDIGYYPIPRSYLVGLNIEF